MESQPNFTRPTKKIWYPYRRNYSITLRWRESSPAHSLKPESPWYQSLLFLYNIELYKIAQVQTHTSLRHIVFPLNFSVTWHVAWRYLPFHGTPIILCVPMSGLLPSSPSLTEHHGGNHKSWQTSLLLPRFLPRRHPQWWGEQWMRWGRQDSPVQRSAHLIQCAVYTASP